MGMASQAPYDSYKPHYEITDGALRFVRFKLRDTTEHQSDRAVRNIVDSAVHDARQRGLLQKVRNKAKDGFALLVDVTEDLGMKEAFYAIVLPDRHDATQFTTVVGFVNQEGHDRFVDTGVWSRAFLADDEEEEPDAPATVPSTSRATLAATKGAAALTALRSSIPAERPAEAASSASVVPLPTPVAPARSAAGLMLISYLDVEGRMQVEQWEEAAALARLTAIKSGDLPKVNPKSARLWREVKIKVKVEIE